MSIDEIVKFKNKTVIVKTPFGDFKGRYTKDYFDIDYDFEDVVDIQVI
ncbi:hypothetical protein [Pseudolactococcus insecticola]|uniref:Uncharacterized protein n=1 Tax=Pseudolactococcus insecticola TaxID=2709158 RepID=A0A6A0B8M3_9LACT|nr:hypothetical protein [Lactococcus insecticola]GFH40704.1 hypothetical protein Hs20B_11020 [Lactococcus insecticola]